jgi:anti-sigma factor RsiW
MKAECRSARRAILLGEGGGGHVDSHLRDCVDCRDFEQSERSMARLVRERAVRPEAPHALRERVVAALEKERLRSQQRWAWWWIRRGGVAALLLAAVISGLYYRHGVAEAQRTVEAVIADHFEQVADGAGAQLAAASTDQIRELARSKLKLAVRVPALPQAKLIGGRPCRLRDRPAVMILYRLGGSDSHVSTASLFVFRSSGERWSAMEVLPGSRSKRICHAHDRGLSVLVWEDRTVTYALVTEIDQPRLQELARDL